jgi:hypothetical protein
MSALGVFFFFVITLINVSLTGFVLTQLWSWFMVPTFHFAALTLQSAIGLSLIIKLLIPGPFLNESDVPLGLSLLISIGHTLLISLTILTIGVLVKGYM